jgi:hypothetical protein
MYSCATDCLIKKHYFIVIEIERLCECCVCVCGGGGLLLNIIDYIERRM